MLTITNSTFYANIATDRGGGIYNGEELELSNSTFKENNANTSLGGGVFNDILGTLTLVNTTFSGNSAYYYGGAIYNWGVLNYTNTILANSLSGGDCYNNSESGEIGININNLVETNAAAPNSCGTPLLTVDPKLGALADNGGSTQTMSLLYGSPAIDAGDDASCAATDQRGAPRPQGSHCDLGAYEVNNATLLITINSHPFNPTNSTSAAFTFSVNDNGGSGITLVECQLDGSGFGACTSPRNYNNLGVGSHTFQVKATDTLGYWRVTAFSWVIDTSPPDTTITAQPPNPDSDYTPSFSFSGIDGSGIASFMCKVDGDAFNPCTSPYTSTALLPGPHTFNVFAIDNASNADPTPASYAWTVLQASALVTSIVRANDNPSSASSVEFTVKFSVDVTGVDGGDFLLATSGVSSASIKSVSGLGDTYTVNVGTGVRSGTIRLDLSSSSNIVDGLGNPLTNLPYLGGEAYSIVKTATFADVLFTHPYYSD